MYEGVQCAFDGCDKPAYTKHLCSGHVQQLRRGMELKPLGWRPPKEIVLCKEDDCEKEAARKGWCHAHYRQMLRGGRTQPIRVSDGRYVDDVSGYVYLRAKGHSEAAQRGWGLEHRIVMSDHLGRPLFPDENVHHINGVKDDNRQENLELWSRSQPAGQRVIDKLAWAREIIRRYGAEPMFNPRLTP